jgi:type IV secretion system protein VirD4
MRLKKARNNAVGPQVHEQTDGRGRYWRTVVARLLFVTLSVVAGFAAATQYFAYEFSYHPQLGFNVGHVYQPFHILLWSARYGAEYPDSMMRAASVGSLVTIVLFLVLVISTMIRARSVRTNDYLHGSARWAEPEHIRSAGLLSDAPDSVYVGAVYDKRGRLQYLRHSGPEHVLAFAPTRSGKGVGLVIPTLLSWIGSAIIADLKGELWALTAGWRQKYGKNRVLRFEPALRDGGVAWNPLEEIRREEDAAGDVEFNFGDIQNIATLIVDPDGKGLENHWSKTAFALLTGVIHHALYLEHHGGPTATLPQIDRLLSDPTRPVADLWKEMTEFPHAAGRPLEAIVQAARDMMDRPDEEAGSVLSTAKSFLSLYRDPIVAQNVSRCDFRIKDLMHHTDPVSLYVVTQPNDKQRLRPLVRILFNMTVRLLADKMDFEDGRPVKAYRHRLLVMLDEFTSLGKMDILQESLAFVAGYGLKFYIIIQDLSQIRARESYGRDESITSNCHVQVAFPPNRMETAEHLSRLTGQTTIVKDQITTSGKRASPLLSNVTVTSQEVGRPLLTPDEAMRMPSPEKDAAGMIVKPGHMVIYVAGNPAIYGVQPLYFQDATFQARAAVPPPAQSDRTQQPAERVVLALPEPAPAAAP